MSTALLLRPLERWCLTDEARGGTVNGARPSSGARPLSAQQVEAHDAGRDADEAALAALTSRLAGPTKTAGLLLDIGAGTGRPSEPVAATGRRVVGLDVSPDMIAATRARIWPAPVP